MGRLGVQAALEYTNISWSLPLNYPTMLNPSYMLLALPAYCRPTPRDSSAPPALAIFREVPWQEASRS